MSKVKSYSVGNGDMFTIEHNSSNFTIIDCDYENEDTFDLNLKEIKERSGTKQILRFISTHPDEDHIKGLKKLDDELNIPNFYCVKNEARKQNETEDFKKYLHLKDSSKAAYLFKGLKRKWLNDDDGTNGCSGIKILWPIINDVKHIEALNDAYNYKNYNNLSSIFTYSIDNGAKFIWMGDMEYDYLEKIKDKIEWSKVDVVFAPHHGRKTGKISKEILDKLQQKLIIIGEAPSEDLYYYDGYDTITQNSSGNITLISNNNYIDIYVEREEYNSNISGLINRCLSDCKDGFYLGSLKI